MLEWFFKLSSLPNQYFLSLTSSSSSSSSTSPPSSSLSLSSWKNQSFKILQQEISVWSREAREVFFFAESQLLYILHYFLFFDEKFFLLLFFGGLRFRQKATGLMMTPSRLEKWFSKVFLKGKSWTELKMKTWHNIGFDFFANQRTSSSKQPIRMLVSKARMTTWCQIFISESDQPGQKKIRRVQNKVLNCRWQNEFQIKKNNYPKNRNQSVWLETINGVNGGLTVQT